MDSKKVSEEFLELVVRHQGIIHKVCNSYCGKADNKLDLYQEIIYQLLKAYPSYRGDSKISTWMYRVALNTAITGFRKEKKNEFIRVPEDRLLSIANPDTEDDEKISLLYTAINQLSKIEKAIILLYLEEYSYQEIAEIIGITTSNVGVKLTRIKTRLELIIKELQPKEIL